MKKLYLTKIILIHPILYTIIGLFCGLLYIPTINAYIIDLPSSFNPVGSGARALGMGGAFIAVANDATAASWNHGGLFQRNKPELSIVYDNMYRKEERSIKEKYQSHNQSLSLTGLNYLSFTYPFTLINRNMIFSINYQKLYDLNTKYLLKKSGKIIDYTQKGKLCAYGFAYCIRILKNLSFGFTLNVWDDFLNENGWYEKQIDFFPEYSAYLIRKNDFSMNAINANFGFIWKINDSIVSGVVLKLPFNSNISKKYFEDNQSVKKTEYDNETLEFPVSYGIGIAWDFRDNLIFSGDIYRTNWNHFIHRSSDGIYSPITGEPPHLSNVKPTHQVRFGIEYLMESNKEDYTIPFRCGLFYDPAPAKNKTDDFWGISFGTGFITEIFYIDIAYQYRWGNDTKEYILENIGFSQDLKEHSIYASYVYHFGLK